MHVSQTFTLIVLMVNLLTARIQGQANRRQPVANPRGSAPRGSRQHPDQPVSSDRTDGHPATAGQQPSTSGRTGPRRQTAGRQQPTLSGGQQPTSSERQQPTTAGKQHPGSPGQVQTAPAGGQQPTSSERQQPATVGRQLPGSPGQVQSAPAGGLQPTSSERQQPATAGRQHPGSLGQVQPASANRQQPANAGKQHPGSPGQVQPAPAGRQPTSSERKQPALSGRQQPATAGRQHPGFPAQVQPAPAGRQQPTSSERQQPALPGRQRPDTAGRQHPGSPGQVQPAPAGRQQPTSSERQQPALPGRQQPDTAGRQHPGSSGQDRLVPPGRQQPANGRRHPGSSGQPQPGAARQQSAPYGRQQPASPVGSLTADDQASRPARQPRRSSGNGNQQPPLPAQPDVTGIDQNNNGEDGRSPRQQRIDTRNTVCQTVCHCQNSGAYCQQKDLKSIPQPFPYGLNLISLEQNAIASIPANTFSRQEYSSVTQLKLSSNKISEIKTNTFSGLSAVEEIYLMTNKIEKLEDDAFFGLNVLSVLSLSSNRLKTLNPKAFSNLTTLRGIGLENNKLQTIPAEIFDALPSLTQLAIGGNPWKCDCNLLGLLIWLQSDNQLQGNSPKCSSPEKFKGKRLVSFSTKGIQDLCDEDSGNDEGTDSPSVEKLVEKQCSSHNSTKPINVCYISDALYTLPGKRVCLHCSATVDEVKLEKLINPRKLSYKNYNPYTKEYIASIQWIVPESSNLNSSVNKHSNGTFCISSPQREDSGQYLCVARIGNITDEKRVELIIADFPNKDNEIPSTSASVNSYADSFTTEYHNFKAQVEYNLAVSQRVIQELKNAFRVDKERTETIAKEVGGIKAALKLVDTKIASLQKMVAGQSDQTSKLKKEMNEREAAAVTEKGKINEEVNKIQELKNSLENLKKSVDELDRNRGAAGGGSAAALLPENLAQMFEALERQLGMYDVRIAEMDLRFQVLETTSYGGCLVWRIRDFDRRREDAKRGRTLSLYSQPFYTSRYGYKMCTRIYLNGDGMGKGTHISLFFVVMKGEYDALVPWPFRQKVTLMLLDQGPDRRHLSDTFRPDPTSSSFKRPTSDMNIASGCPLFVAHTVLDGSNFVKDDTIFVRVVVDTADLENF